MGKDTLLLFGLVGGFFGLGLAGIYPMVKWAARNRPDDDPEVVYGLQKARRVSVPGAALGAAGLVLIVLWIVL